MRQDIKEKSRDEFVNEMAPLAGALLESRYRDILLYEPNDVFRGTCDGQVYPFETDAIKDDLLSTKILQEDDLMPITISADIKPSQTPEYPVILETICTLGDCWRFSIQIPYSRDLKSHFAPVLLVKYCNESERGLSFNSSWASLFETERNIFMRRLSSDGKIRPRVKYTVGDLI